MPERASVKKQIVSQANAPTTVSADTKYQALEEHILRLEKQLSTTTSETQTPKVDVTVSDMNMMYKNHLDTIDFMFVVVGGLIVIAGFFLTWLGQKTIKSMIDQKISDVTETKTKEAIKASQEKIEDESKKAIKEAIEPIKEQHKKYTELQQEQQQHLKELDKKTIINSHLQSGHEALQRDDFQLAIKEYDNVIDLDRNNGSAYLHRGNAKSRLNKNEDAIIDFTKAIDLNQNNDAAYTNRGIAKSKLNLVEEAIEDFTEAIKLEPQNSTAYGARGYARHGLNQHKEALTDLNESILLAPNKITSYANRGCVKHDTGQYDEALKDYRKALSLAPNTSQVVYNISTLYTLMNRPLEEILENLERAIKLSSEHMGDAINDSDFKRIRNEPKFRKLVGLPPLK